MTSASPPAALDPTTTAALAPAGEEAVIEANGIQWEIYDEGPEDGTQLTARGTVKPITVLVSVQGPVGDSAAGPSTQTVVAQVARSVVVDPIVSA